MPHTIMNGITAHAFAFVMTAAVITYPSANDFIDDVLSQEPSRVSIVASEIDRSFPELNGTIRPERLLIQQLEACTQAQASAAISESVRCAAAVEAAREAVNTSGPMTHQQEMIAAKLKLANALYCREKWAHAKTEDTSFDVEDCQNRIIALADNT